jgi:hypothetical protein
MGRGRGLPHGQGQQSQIPVIGIDYFFITQRGIKRRPQESDLEPRGPADQPRVEEEQDASPEGGIVDEAAVEAARTAGKIVKCILVRDFHSKCTFAHVVPCKGIDEERYVAKMVADDIVWLGYGELAVKADNEASLNALIRVTIDEVRSKRSNVKITTEAPAPYESQSNGATEVGVRNVRGLFRTLKLCLENRIGSFIEIEHAIIPWLLEHTCMVLNTRSRGSDGRTPWMRIRGRSFNQALMGLCEQTLYKLPTKGPMANPDGNMGARYHDGGTFLGYSRSANVYIIATDPGVRFARSVMRRPVIR